MSTFFHESIGRLKSIFRRKRMDREMAEELEFHQELLRDKLLGEGVPASQVEASVRRAFGNPQRWQERLRELWQFRTLENLLRDLSFSFRLLRKSPGFTAVAILTMVLGLGANVAVFSLVNSLLIRSLPVPHSEELAVVGVKYDGPDTTYSLPAPFFRALESHHEIFAHVFAFNRPQKLLVRGKSSDEAVAGLLVSGDYFSALQTPPLAGRYLTPSDDRAGGSPAGLAVVISEQFWQNWFNRAPTAVGSTLRIANTPFTVVGIMPKRFIGADPAQRPDIFVPLSEEPIIDAPDDLTAAGFHGWWLIVMGRLQPGVTQEMANAALKNLSTPILHATVPDASYIDLVEKQHFHFVSEPGAKGFTYVRFFFKKPLVALFCMCGGILLLACMNLASLLMARSAARKRELATRLSLGSTRGRLIQQLLIESLLISILGTGIAMGIGPLVSRALGTSLMSGNSQGLYLDTSLDLRSVAFAALIACGSTLLVGLVPALLATSGNLNTHMKEGQHVRHPKEHRRLLPRLLLASEVGLALLLVVSAGLLATSLIRLYGSGIGFDPRGVVNIELNTEKQPLDGEPLLRLYRQFGESISRQPGVSSFSFSRIIPLTHDVWNPVYSAPGGVTHELFQNGVGPDYFRTMRIPILAGRDFRWDDTPSTGLKIILNQTAARLFFPGQEAIGQRIVNDKDKPALEVIAVVGDAKYDDLHSAAPPSAYVPITQFQGPKPSYFVVLRTAGRSADAGMQLGDAARTLAARLAPEIPAPVLTTMDSVVNDSISTERVMAVLSVFFAGCALLVTAIGLYGTLAYSTARRTSEIGIRMALGAQRAGVVALVFRENAVVALAGCAAGLAAAVFASRVLSSFLYATSPRDPWILVGSVAALAAIASAASLLPALRAARIEPITAIRCE